MENKKIQNFRDLKVWQEGHSLAISVYKLGGLISKTRSFISLPKSNFHSLISVFCLILISNLYVLISALLAHAATIAKPSNLLTINTGLVGWWTMDGKDLINNVVDRSGLGNNGYMSGFTSTSSAQTAGKIGQALKFDGSDDYVNTGNSSWISQSFSLSAWVNSSYTAATQIIEAKLSGSSDWQFYYGLLSNGKITFKIYGSTAVSNNRTYDTSTGGFNDGKWHLVTVTITDINGSISKTVNIYVDGVLYPNTVTMEIGDQSMAYSVQASNIFIGARFTPTLTLPFKGKIDDVRIYNRALSANEILALYKSGSAKFASSPQVQSTACSSGLSCGLVGWWTFDGKDLINNVVDNSGSGNNGYMSGFTSTSSAQVAGKLGQALKFDGVDDYVNLENTFNTLAVPLSFSVWIKSNKAVSGVNSQGIIETDRRGNTVHSGAMLTLGSNGKIGLAYGSNTVCDSNGRRTKEGNTVLTSNKWYHISGVIRGATDMSIYINGVDDGGTYSGAGGTMVNTSYKASIGTMNQCPTPGNLVFNGSLDDVRIYNRALSASEIQKLYKSGEAKFATSDSGQGLNSGLVGHWTMDGKDINWATNKISDKSGNGNTGQILNMSTTTSPVLGKIGQALKFDVVDDYVKVPYNSSLYSTTMAVSFWAKSNVTSYSTIGYPVSMYDYSADNRVWGIQIRTTTNKWSIITSTNGTVAGAGFDETTQSVQLGWHHITAVTSNGGDTWTFYYDGASPQTLTDTVAYSNQNSFITIGGLTDTGYFNGSIDDVRIYNRALSATEIQQLYNMGR